MRARAGNRVSPLLIIAIVAGAWLPSRAAAQAPADLRIMSFNIRVDTDKGANRWELRRDKVVKVIDDFDPDILGMQEDRDHQGKYILNRLPRYTAFGRASDLKGRGEHNTILYRTDRFTALRSGTFWLSPTPDKPGSKGWGAKLARTVNWIELADDDNPGLTFVVMNTHWEHAAHGAKARLQSAALMRRKMAEIAPNTRVVFTGDFNADQGTAPYDRMTGRDEDDDERFLIDTYRKRHPDDSDTVGTGHKFTGKPHGNRIDWILHDKGFDALHAAIVRTSFNGRYPSDHFPITATIEPVPDADVK
jgi:endonuclease/exonuclease/phosphatase family metal-dependent hydrolase